jgi:hypothetical protein
MKTTMTTMMVAMCLAAATATAAPRPFTASVPATDGTFEVALTLDDDRLSGTVKNATPYEWLGTEFTVLLFKQDGTPLLKKGYRGEDEQIFIGADRLTPGEEKKVIVSSWGVKGIKDLARVELKVSRAFTVRVVKPAKVEGLKVDHAAASIDFSFADEDGISFSLTNKLDAPIQIDWNATSYVDTTNEAQRVMHSGVKFIDRDKPMVPTTIPPGAAAKDIMIPISNVNYSSGAGAGWRTRALFGDWIYGHVPMKPGGTFSVLLALVVDGKTQHVYTTFEVDRLLQ